MISLPFSTIFQAYRTDSVYTSRYNGEKWDTLTRVLQTGLDVLLAEPERFLKEVRLDPGKYDIEKRRFPEGVTINGNPILPFPVLIVKDRSHKKWLEGFKRRIKRERTLSGKDVYRRDYLFSAIDEIKNGNEDSVPFKIPDVSKAELEQEAGSHESSMPSRDKKGGQRSILD